MEVLKCKCIPSNESTLHSIIDYRYKVLRAKLSATMKRLHVSDTFLHFNLFELLIKWVLN